MFMASSHNNKLINNIQKFNVGSPFRSASDLNAVFHTLTDQSDFARFFTISIKTV